MVGEREARTRTTSLNLRRLLVAEMSLELDWSTVDYELTRSVHGFLSDAFAATALPDFVGPISLDHFSFGDEQPDIDILDITDIDKQFLLPDDDHDSEDDQLPPPPPRSRSRSRSRSHSPAPFNTATLESDSIASPPAGAGGPRSSAPSPSFQLLVRISYSGNLSLALSTSLRINYPSPAFMSLPLQLSLTDLAFQGVLVVAFEGGKNRIHISLVEAPAGSDTTPNQPTTTSLASMMAATSSSRPTTMTAAARAATKKERFLRSAHVESRVGNADKHVLRNVGKVEKFVLDVARTTLENELVFPCVSLSPFPLRRRGFCACGLTSAYLARKQQLPDHLVLMEAIRPAFGPQGRPRPIIRSTPQFLISLSAPLFCPCSPVSQGSSCCHISILIHALLSLLFLCTRLEKICGRGTFISSRLLSAISCARPAAARAPMS